MSIAEKLTTIAENVQKVYEAGKAAGGDTFVDEYQQNGDRVHYSYAFAGRGWTNDTFKPKYNMKPTVAVNMFYGTKIVGDLVEILENLGISLDFSDCTNHGSIFNSADRITRLGVMDFSKSSSNLVSNTFGGMSELVQIDEFNVSETEKFSNTFTNDYKLERLTMSESAKIGQNGFNVQWCPLTHDSLMSIINALADKSADTSGTTWTVTLGDTNIAKLTETELASIEAKGWNYA